MKNEPAEPIGQVLATATLQEIAEYLIKREGLHEGLYAVEPHWIFGNGLFKSEDRLMPSIVAGLSALNLRKIEANHPLSEIAVDAAKVNPKKKTTKK